MIKIAVCDDEEEMCENLSNKISAVLKKLNTDFYIKCYSNPMKFYGSDISFDIAFIDIQMPGLNGMTLAKKLYNKQSGTALIFVTVLKEYMQEAFEVEAADYILKPVDEIRLEAALKRVLKSIDKNRQSIVVKKGSGLISIKISSIYYCEVISRKIYIHTTDGITDFYGNFNSIEKSLDLRFIKCHRSYIFNIDYLKEFNGREVILENGESIPVSRLRRNELVNEIFSRLRVLL